MSTGPKRPVNNQRTGPIAARLLLKENQMNIEPTGSLPANTPLPPSDVSAIFERLRQLDRKCGPTANLHDRVTVLICACIEEGINAGPRIIGAIKHIGYNSRHVGKLLRDGTGNDPRRHWWYRDPVGTYRNYPQSDMADVGPMNG